MLLLELCSQCFITKVFTVRWQLRSNSEMDCIHQSDNVFVRINFNGKFSVKEDEQLGGWDLFSITMHVQAAPTVQHGPHPGGQPGAALTQVKIKCGRASLLPGSSIQHVAGPLSALTEGAWSESTWIGSTKFIQCTKNTYSIMTGNWMEIQLLKHWTGNSDLLVWR